MNQGIVHKRARVEAPQYANDCIRRLFWLYKIHHGFKRFLLKSTRKVSVEWGLVSLAHNLRKYVAQKTKERDKYAQNMKIDRKISLLRTAIIS